MAGSSSITGSESIIFADNASFDGSERGGAMSADGELWIGSSAGSPSVVKSTLTAGAGVTIANGPGSITISLTGGGAAIDEFNPDVGANIAPDGTGTVNVTGTSIFSSGSVANTLTLNVEATANTFLYGQGADTNVAELGPLTNGQLIIGSTGVAPVAGGLASADGSITISLGAGTIDLSVAAADDAILTLTGDTGGALSPTAGNINILGGTNISVAGAGSTLTINTTGAAAFNWVVETGATRSLSINQGVFGNRGTAQTFTLPTTAAVGDMVCVAQMGAGNITIDYGTGEFIQFGSTTSTTTTGSIVSTQVGDTVCLVCRVANTEWQVISSIGNWTIN